MYIYIGRNLGFILIYFLIEQTSLLAQVLYVLACSPGEAVIPLENRVRVADIIFEV